MRRKSILASIAALVVIGALVYFYGGSQVPSGQPPLARLTTQNLSQIETAFNAATTDVRLLVLLSPT
ncbi:MAG TPA: hypothetical protein VH325_03285 [Bryobacteraceae bacterium]|jgi:hypothetical protein|nr:hypothetical protein [Bryobacteraceae bacterium]